jgi:hypothetical protein
MYFIQSKSPGEKGMERSSLARGLKKPNPQLKRKSKRSSEEGLSCNHKITFAKRVEKEGQDMTGNRRKCEKLLAEFDFFPSNNP